MWFLISFPLYGDSISEEKKNEDLKEYEVKQEQEEEEIAHLQWKLGGSVFRKTVDNKTTGRQDKIIVYKAPIFLEFQVPFNAKIRGLVQTGFGWMQTNYNKCEDEEGGWKISYEDRETKITTFKECNKWKKEKPVSTGYWMVQPGLQYNFGSFTGVLAGGGFLNLKKEIGFMAGLFIRGIIVKGLDFGVEMLSYKGQNYYGISIKWGTDLKTWTRME